MSAATEPRQQPLISANDDEEELKPTVVDLPDIGDNSDTVEQAATTTTAAGGGAGGGKLQPEGSPSESQAAARPTSEKVQKNLSLAPGDFFFGAALGEGSYARVVHARMKRHMNEGTIKDFAIKIMEKDHIVKENKVNSITFVIFFLNIYFEIGIFANCRSNMCSLNGTSYLRLRTHSSSSKLLSYLESEHLFIRF